MCAALQWAVLPFYGYIVLRSFISALERPGWALVIVFVAVAFNAFANWCLMFGNLGFPAHGHAGSGLATTLSSVLMFAGMAAVVMLETQFRRYRLFGRFWRADWPRFKALLKLGLPIAGILAFEVTIFNAAAFLMGLIGAASLAAHAIAIQIASISFMVPLGLGQAVTVRVGLAHGARQSGRRHPRRLDRLCDRRRLHGADGAGDDPVAASADQRLHRPRRSGERRSGRPGRHRSSPLPALFQIVDGAQAVAAGMLRGLHDTKVPMIYAAIGYWGVGLPLGVLLAFHVGLKGVGIWIGLSSGLAVVAVLLLGAGCGATGLG